MSPDREPTSSDLDREAVALLEELISWVRKDEQAALRRVIALARRAEELEDFALALIKEWEWGGDVDGGSLQDMAVEHGLLIPTEVTEPCGEACRCVEYDDFPQTCYRLAPDLLARREADKEGAHD